MTDANIETVTVLTPPCPVCDETHELVVPALSFQAWMDGGTVQDAFPQLTPAQRELLITGTDAACFAELFPPDESRWDD